MIVKVRRVSTGAAVVTVALADGTADRWVLADLTQASSLWREMADLVVCGSQPSLPQAWAAVQATFMELPGCGLAIAGYEGGLLIGMHGGGRWWSLRTLPAFPVYWWCPIMQGGHAGGTSP